MTFAGRAERALLGATIAGAVRVARRGSAQQGRGGFGPRRRRRHSHLSEIEQAADGSRATLTLPDGRRGGAPARRCPGVHNLRNATAALGAVLALWADRWSRRSRRWRSTAGWVGGSSGWARCGASRSSTTTPITPPSWSPRSRPRGRPFPVAGWWRSSSRISSPAPRSTARPWDRRWRRPMWSS